MPPRERLGVELSHFEVLGEYLSYLPDPGVLVLEVRPATRKSFRVAMYVPDDFYLSACKHPGPVRLTGQVTEGRLVANTMDLQ